MYVGNLAFTTSEDALRDAFGQFGTVTEVHIASDRLTGRPRGFAFITMGTAEECKLAIEKMNGSELEGRALTVNEAKPRDDATGATTAGGRVYTSPNRKAGAFQQRGNRRH
jgi:RNA recognition motif-containing protein